MIFSIVSRYYDLRARPALYIITGLESYIEFIDEFSRRIQFSFRVVHIPYKLSSICLCCLAYIYFTLNSAPIGKESLAHSLRNKGSKFNVRLGNIKLRCYVVEGLSSSNIEGWCKQILNFSEMA